MENQQIRIRACLAVIRDKRILLVPHYNTDSGHIQWNLPGGRVEYGESLQQTALRELTEETGITAQITSLLDVSEVILPERPWHSITISYLGEFLEGELKSETGHAYGEKIPQWFTIEQLCQERYHPTSSIQKAMGI